MPYKIFKVKGGWKVGKESGEKMANGRKFASDKPLSLKEAKKQMAAIGISRSRRMGSPLPVGQNKIVITVLHGECFGDQDRMCDRKSRKNGKRVFELFSSGQEKDSSTRSYIMKKSGDVIYLDTRMHRGECDHRIEDCKKKSQFFQKLDSIVTKETVIVNVHSSPNDKDFMVYPESREDLALQMREFLVENLELKVELEPYEEKSHLLHERYPNNLVFSVYFS